MIIVITLLFASSYNTSLEFGNNINEIYAQSTQNRGEEHKNHLKSSYLEVLLIQR